MALIRDQWGYHQAQENEDKKKKHKRRGSMKDGKKECRKK
jgi:hypothetical protein